jgi:hypothetical protein
MSVIQTGDHVVIALPAVYETLDVEQFVQAQILALQDQINPAITVSWLRIDPTGSMPRILFINRTADGRPYRG